MLATGRTLEFFTRKRAERKLRALIDRAPRFAKLQDEGSLREIPVEQIQPNQPSFVTPLGGDTGRRSVAKSRRRSG